ncbi:hypothetical protein B1222_08375 [Paenibacillus larvae subsp. pulvifaciens]|nr:hypothetical protein B1222_08375 [Paenibacillus larvae subsp. pulvifaciens]AQZ46393.1 hypothetical protein B5S25_06940 [Paenibacillus larvae subsp. pulvifaciens]MBH0344310.1 hypothetical protein [Paenibacillus larvae]
MKNSAIYSSYFDPDQVAEIIHKEHDKWNGMRSQRICNGQGCLIFRIASACSLRKYDFQTE